ncbi:uncharacterized protein [Amphiura filiformis]|uniref:uncharacterized protein n=1 Tax=Amphiura filiformis TaxID=82378 RepID=UPI003B218C73
MASKLLFALMALSLFVAIAVAAPFLEEGDDDEDDDFDLMDLLASKRAIHQGGIEGEEFEDLMDKRGAKGRGKGKGKGKGKGNKQQLCPPPNTHCICNAKYAPNDRRFISHCN